MRFESFINEAESEGIKLEKSIIHWWNFLTTISSDEEIPKNLNEKDSNTIAICKILKDQGCNFKDEAIKVPNTTVSSAWKVFGGLSDKSEAKTDVKIGNFNISVKKGSSQILSGTPDEAIATMLSAIQESPIKKETEIFIKRQLERIKKIKGHTTSGSIKTNKLEGNEEILIYDDMNLAVTERLNKAFNKNKEFKVSFIYEALTGKKKFGDGDAVANYLLGVDDKYSNIRLEPITMELCRNLASKIPIRISFKTNSVKKSSTNAYNFYSAFRMYYSNKQNEGLLDVFQNIFNKALKFISQSWANLLSFFNLVPIIEVDEVDLSKIM